MKAVLSSTKRFLAIVLALALVVLTVPESAMVTYGEEVQVTEATEATDAEVDVDTAASGEVDVAADDAVVETTDEVAADVDAEAEANDAVVEDAEAVEIDAETTVDADAETDTAAEKGAEVDLETDVLDLKGEQVVRDYVTTGDITVTSNSKKRADGTDNIVYIAKGETITIAAVSTNNAAIYAEGENVQWYVQNAGDEEAIEAKDNASVVSLAEVKNNPLQMKVTGVAAGETEISVITQVQQDAKAEHAWIDHMTEKALKVVVLDLVLYTDATDGTATGYTGDWNVDEKIANLDMVSSSDTKITKLAEDVSLVITQSVSPNGVSHASVTKNDDDKITLTVMKDDGTYENAANASTNPGTTNTVSANIDTTVTGNITIQPTNGVKNPVTKENYIKVTWAYNTDAKTSQKTKDGLVTFYATVNTVNHTATATVKDSDGEEISEAYTTVGGDPVSLTVDVQNQEKKGLEAGTDYKLTVSNNTSVSETYDQIVRISAAGDQVTLVGLEANDTGKEARVNVTKDITSRNASTGAPDTTTYKNSIIGTKTFTAKVTKANGLTILDYDNGAASKTGYTPGKTVGGTLYLDLGEGLSTDAIVTSLDGIKNKKRTWSIEQSSKKVIELGKTVSDDFSSNDMTEMTEASANQYELAKSVNPIAAGDATVTVKALNLSKTVDVKVFELKLNGESLKDELVGPDKMPYNTVSGYQFGLGIAAVASIAGTETISLNSTKITANNSAVTEDKKVVNYDTTRAILARDTATLSVENGSNIVWAVTSVSTNEGKNAGYHKGSYYPNGIDSAPITIEWLPVEVDKTSGVVTARAPGFATLTGYYEVNSSTHIPVYRVEVSVADLISDSADTTLENVDIGEKEYHVLTGGSLVVDPSADVHVSTNDGTVSITTNDSDVTWTMEVTKVEPVGTTELDAAELYNYPKYLTATQAADGGSYTFTATDSITKNVKYTITATPKIAEKTPSGDTTSYTFYIEVLQSVDISLKTATDENQFLLYSVTDNNAWKKNIEITNADSFVLKHGTADTGLSLVDVEFGSDYKSVSLAPKASADGTANSGTGVINFYLDGTTITESTEPLFSINVTLFDIARKESDGSYKSLYTMSTSTTDGSTSEEYALDLILFDGATKDYESEEIVMMVGDEPVKLGSDTEAFAWANGDNTSVTNSTTVKLTTTDNNGAALGLSQFVLYRDVTTSTGKTSTRYNVKDELPSNLNFKVNSHVLKAEITDLGDEDVKLSAENPSSVIEPTVKFTYDDKVTTAYTYTLERTFGASSTETSTFLDAKVDDTGKTITVTPTKFNSQAESGEVIHVTAKVTVNGNPYTLGKGTEAFATKKYLVVAKNPFNTNTASGENAWKPSSATAVASNKFYAFTNYAVTAVDADDVPSAATEVPKLTDAAKLYNPGSSAPTYTSKLSGFNTGWSWDSAYADKTIAELAEEAASGKHDYVDIDAVYTVGGEVLAKQPFRVTIATIDDIEVDGLDLVDSSEKNFDYDFVVQTGSEKTGKVKISLTNPKGEVSEKDSTDTSAFGGLYLANNDFSVVSDTPAKFGISDVANGSFKVIVASTATSAPATIVVSTGAEGASFVKNIRAVSGSKIAGVGKPTLGTAKAMSNGDYLFDATITGTKDTIELKVEVTTPDNLDSGLDVAETAGSSTTGAKVATLNGVSKLTKGTTAGSKTPYTAKITVANGVTGYQDFTITATDDSALVQTVRLYVLDDTITFEPVTVMTNASLNVPTALRYNFPAMEWLKAQGLTDLIDYSITFTQANTTDGNFRISTEENTGVVYRLKSDLAAGNYTASVEYSVMPVYNITGAGNTAYDNTTKKLNAELTISAIKYEVEKAEFAVSQTNTYNLFYREDVTSEDFDPTNVVGAAQLVISSDTAGVEPGTVVVEGGNSSYIVTAGEKVDGVTYYYLQVNGDKTWNKADLKALTKSNMKKLRLRIYPQGFGTDDTANSNVVALTLKANYKAPSYKLSSKSATYYGAATTLTTVATSSTAGEDAAGATFAYGNYDIVDEDSSNVIRLNVPEGTSKYNAKITVTNGVNWAEPTAVLNIATYKINYSSKPALALSATKVNFSSSIDQSATIGVTLKGGAELGSDNALEEPTVNKSGVTAALGDGNTVVITAPKGTATGTYKVSIKAAGITKAATVTVKVNGASTSGVKVGTKGKIEILSRSAMTITPKLGSFTGVIDEDEDIVINGDTTGKFVATRNADGKSFTLKINPEYGGTFSTADKPSFSFTLPMTDGSNKYELTTANVTVKVTQAKVSAKMIPKKKTISMSTTTASAPAKVLLTYNKTKAVAVADLYDEEGAKTFSIDYGKSEGYIKIDEDSLTVDEDGALAFTIAGTNNAVNKKTYSVKITVKAAGQATNSKSITTTLKVKMPK